MRRPWWRRDEEPPRTEEPILSLPAVPDPAHDDYVSGVVNAGSLVLFTSSGVPVRVPIENAKQLLDSGEFRRSPRVPAEVAQDLMPRFERARKAMADLLGDVATNGHLDSDEGQALHTAEREMAALHDAWMDLRYNLHLSYDPKPRPVMRVQAGMRAHYPGENTAVKPGTTTLISPEDEQAFRDIGWEPTGEEPA